MARWVWER